MKRKSGSSSSPPRPDFYGPPRRVNAGAHHSQRPGPPVADRAKQVLRRLYARVGDRLTLISVGGIETAEDAWDRITAGASLLQGYTGFVYGGGTWAKTIHDGLADRLRRNGFSSLSEAVGSSAR